MIFAHEDLALACRWIDEGWNRGNFTLANELAAPTFRYQLAGCITPGDYESCRDVVAMFRHGFPDLQVIIEEQAIDGDLVLTFLTFRGTHHGTFQGIPPTEKQVAFTGLITLRIVDDKIVEQWNHLDMRGLLHELGACPALEAAEH